jgi:probable HAF family extracellular repeat protein
MLLKTRLVPLACAAGIAAPASAQSFTPLGPYPGSFLTLARGVSNGGSVVVGQGIGPVSIPWRWTQPTGMQSMGWTGYAFAVSSDGSTAAGVQGVSPDEAVRWTQSTGPQGLGYLNAAHTSGMASAVSADGSVIVGRSGQPSISRFEAFRWTAAGMQGLGTLPAHNSSWARGVSGDGAVIVGSSLNWPGGSLPSEAFRWSQATGMVGLGFLPGHTGSGAIAISADGSTIIGGSFIVGGVGSQAVRWAQGGPPAALGVLPGTSSGCDALAVSGDGALIVGHCYQTGGATVAFLWTPGAGMRSLAEVLTDDHGLNLAGWTLLSAQAVSADGRAIAGYATFQGGPQEPYLVILPGLCYPNCDGSTTAPVLNVLDFNCFLNAFSAGASYANCDGSTQTPVLNVLDFNCFLNAFSAGVPLR